MCAHRDWFLSDLRPLLTLERVQATLPHLAQMIQLTAGLLSSVARQPPIALLGPNAFHMTLDSSGPELERAKLMARLSLLWDHECVFRDQMARVWQRSVDAREFDPQQGEAMPPRLRLRLHACDRSLRTCLQRIDQATTSLVRDLLTPQHWLNTMRIQFLDQRIEQVERDIKAPQFVPNPDRLETRAQRQSRLSTHRPPDESAVFYGQLTHAPRTLDLISVEPLDGALLLDQLRAERYSLLMANVVDQSA
jgi:hypothetical protein